MTNGTLDSVKFTTHDVSQRLDKPEPQVRLVARQLGIEPPFSQGHYEALQMQFERMDSQVKPEEKNAIAPSPVTTKPEAIAPTESGLSPAFSTFCDSLEAEITQKLRAEMTSRMPAIKAAVVDAIMPQQ